MMKYPKNGDLKKAQELMAQAGVKGYEVEVITSDKDWLRKELELVAAMVRPDRHHLQNPQPRYGRIQQPLAQ